MLYAFWSSVTSNKRHSDYIKMEQINIFNAVTITVRVMRELSTNRIEHGFFFSSKTLDHPRNQWKTEEAKPCLTRIYE